MSKETIIKISRSKYIEESLEVALIRLDTLFHYKGVLKMINYYTDSSQNSFDTVFASGVKDGVGRDCYRIISLHQESIIWGAGSSLPDVSSLVHGEKYLYRDPSGDWWLVQIASDGRTREITELEPGPKTYDCLSDNSKWVVGEDRKARRITDIYSREEIDSLLEEVKNTVRYVEFESLTPTQIETIRGHKGDQGDKGDPGPMGLQGPPGIRGYNGTIENFVVLTQAQYDALDYKDPYKFYFTYEEEDQPQPSEFVAYVEENTLIITATVENGVLDINSAYASYDGVDTINIITSAVSVSTPMFTPLPGTYDGAKTIEIVCPTAGATIRYTLDWTDPTEDSPIYDRPISLGESGTIKARAFKLGLVPSRVATGVYDLLFPRTVSTPFIYPQSGTFDSPQEVTISCSTEDAIIRYTLDSSEPNSASQVYTRPFTVSDNINIVRAKAFRFRYNASDTATEVYEIATYSRVDTPKYSIPSGTYYTPQVITIYTQTPGVTIYYTTDGSTPTTSSKKYTDPITITETTIIRAKAFASGMISSNISTLDIVISEEPPTPPTPGEDVVVNGETIYDRQPDDRVIGNSWIILTTPYPSVINRTLIF